MKFTFACKKISLNDSIKEYAEKKKKAMTAEERKAEKQALKAEKKRKK